MKRLLLLVLLAAAVALPAQAGAAVPCRERIFTDWNTDGKIASTYPHACYVDALHHVPPDANEYSSLRQDITAAMQAAARQLQGQIVPKQVGRGFAPHNVLATAHAPASAPHDPAPSQVSVSKTPSVKSSSPVVASSSSSGAPLPVLLLGGIALALVAAGAVGAGVRHARSRRR